MAELLIFEGEYTFPIVVIETWHSTTVGQKRFIVVLFQVIGKRGVVDEIDEDGDVVITFGEISWTLNPECLSPCTGNADNLKFTEDAPADKRKCIIIDDLINNYEKCKSNII